MSRQKQKRKEEKQNMADLELQEFIRATNFKSQRQKLLHESIMRNDVTLCDGPAGCGKTFLAL